MRYFRTWFENNDPRIIRILKILSGPLSRISLFIVFFWFGALKLFEASPANTLVDLLLERTLPFLPFSSFVVFLGAYEMLIGLLFIIPRGERIAIALLLPHMLATLLPLMLLPQFTWNAFLVPTLEGQYIIKNLALITLAIGIGSRLEPARKRS